jgi:hypothetical protein
MHIRGKTKKQLIKIFTRRMHDLKNGDREGMHRIAHLKGALRDRGVKVL